MTPSGVSLTFYLFPEALERRGRGWKSLASFLPSEPHCPFWTWGVQHVRDQGEELSQRGSMGAGGHSVSSVSSDQLLPAPPAFRPAWARLRVGPLAALSLIVWSALGMVLGNSESRKARPQRGSRGDTGLEQGCFLL